MERRVIGRIRTKRWQAPALFVVPALGGRDTSASGLELLAREGAPIAIVRVERLHEVEQRGERIDPVAWPEKTIRVAECRVERMLLGDPRVTRMAIGLRGSGKSDESYALAVGARALVFADGESTRFWRANASPQTLEWLEKLTGPNGATLALAGGVWRIEGTGAQASIAVPNVVTDLPDVLERDRKAGSLSLEAVIGWVDAEIERVTPSLSVRVISTGPRPWSIQIEPDGTWRGTESGALPADASERLWESLEAERVFDLPDEVGASRTPCPVSFEIRARSRAGAFRVHVYPEAPDQIADPDRRALMERARRVWAALPGQAKPALFG